MGNKLNRSSPAFKFSPSSVKPDVVSVPVVEKLAKDGLGTLLTTLFSFFEETVTPITGKRYVNVLSKRCLRTNCEVINIGQTHARFTTFTNFLTRNNIYAYVP